MTIRWHCRGCNETGEQKFDLNKLLEKRKDEDLLTLALNEIKHECSNTNIGLKVGD